VVVVSEAATAADLLVPITCSASGPLTPAGNALITDALVPELGSTPIPLEVQGTVDAPASVDKGEVAHFEITISQDFQPLATTTLNDTIKPAIAQPPGSAAIASTAALNLHIDDLITTVPIPDGTTVQGTPTVSMSVGGPAAVIREVEGALEVEVDGIAANARQASAYTTTTLATTPPFDVTIGFDLLVPEDFAGTSLDLLAGPMSFAFTNYDPVTPGFNVSIKVLGTPTFGGANGPFACTPDVADQVLSSTVVNTPTSSSTLPETSPFVDVPLDHPFFDEVVWLVDRGIANGYPGNLFKPTDPVTRQAMATFLYRYAGNPNGNNPLCANPAFADVPADHPFCGEIAWLVEQGVANGFPGNLFKPTDPVTRQAAGTFLYRFAESPDGADPTCATDAFVDVTTSHPFCGEISWMVAEGITNGYAGNLFKPTNAVTRQAMATFLFRLDGSQTP